MKGFVAKLPAGTKGGSWEIPLVLYGGDTHVSDKVYRIGCDVYEFVSGFEKITL